MFTKDDAVPVGEQDVSSGTAVFGDGTLHSNQSFLQETRPCDVVRMAVRVHWIMQRKEHTL